MPTVAAAALHFYQRLSEQLLPDPALGTQGILMLCDRDWSLPDQDVLSVAKALVRRICPGAIEPMCVMGWQNIRGPTGGGLVLDLRVDALAPLQPYARQAVATAGPGVVLVSNEMLTGAGMMVLAFRRNETVFSAVALALKSLEGFLGVKVDVVAPVRFMSGGLSAAIDVGLFAPSQQQRGKYYEHEVLSLCRTLCVTWVYRGRQVTAEHAAKWVEQFRAAGLTREAMDVIKYLNCDGFLTRNYIIECISKQYQRVLKKYPGVQEVSVQGAGKSESYLLYDLRLQPGRVVSFSAALKNYSKNATLVCFDDVIGSGGTFISALFRNQAGVTAEKVGNWLDGENNCIAVVSAIASEAGKRRIEDHVQARGRVKVFAHRLIRNGEATFHEKSKIFSSGSSEQGFMEFCRLVGGDIYPIGPLGYYDSRWCIATEYNVPNNSLPVIFAKGNARREWMPLFERV